MAQGMNVLALVKDGQRYVFLYDDDSRPDVLRTLGVFAADKELTFTWYDAAVLSQKVRTLQKLPDPVAPAGDYVRLCSQCGKPSTYTLNGQCGDCGLNPGSD